MVDTEETIYQTCALSVSPRERGHTTQSTAKISVTIKFYSNLTKLRNSLHISL